MSVKCPVISTTAIVSDDPQFAASLSCALSQRNSYLPLLSGPRLTRADRQSEIIRRTISLSRAGSRQTLLAGLSSDAQSAMIDALPEGHAKVVDGDDPAVFSVDPKRASRPRLKWGSDRIGLGVLTALYAGRLIEFVEMESPRIAVSSKSGHLVVCEDFEPLSQVIAANYAFALNAGLHVFDEVGSVVGDRILESYYSIDRPGSDAAAERMRLIEELRDLIGHVELPPNGSITFISQQLPFGVAFPELPSTHLFSYPDLGRAIVNGFAAEQPGTRGTNVAVLVNPQKVNAPEIQAARELLPKRRIFVRGYEGPGASVRAVGDMVDLFPYDLLLFATHCGDAQGHRWTYEFKDSEGIDRCLVVDIAIGVGQTDEEDLLQVMQFTRFHTLDGVDWNDTDAKADLYVGTAIDDYIKQTKNGELKPVKKETIPRVLGSAAMAMADNNYIPVPRALAAERTPVIINNACVSWHQLAVRFLFADARAYIGTLYPVSDIEAEAVVVAILNKYFGKMLPHALWSAQNLVYGSLGDRRPYVVSGVFPQRLRVTKEDVPKHILSLLFDRLLYWKSRAEMSPDENSDSKKAVEDIATYYEREFFDFRQRWFKGDAKSK